MISAAADASKGIDQQIDEAFAPISNFFSGLIFYEIAGNTIGTYHFSFLVRFSSLYILVFQTSVILEQPLILFAVNMKILKGITML